MGVVVRRYIDILIIIITFSYSTCISSFLAAASLRLCLFFKCFVILAYIGIIPNPHLEYAYVLLENKYNEKH